MRDFFEDIDIDDAFPQYEAKCQGCDIWGPVDDMCLCGECAGKLERDMIRRREWDYSASAFGCPKDKLEDLRDEVIKMHGSKLELLAEDNPEKKKAKKDRRRNRRKR